MSHTPSFQVFIFAIVAGVLYVLEEPGERRWAKSLPGPHFSSSSFGVPSFSPSTSGRGVEEGDRGGWEASGPAAWYEAGRSAWMWFLVLRVSWGKATPPLQAKAGRSPVWDLCLTGLGSVRATGLPPIPTEAAALSLLPRRSPEAF